MVVKVSVSEPVIQSLDVSFLPMHPYKFDSIICFGGEDWWYHNRGHIDMQLMRRFARLGTTLYINSIVMQKPDLTQRKKFIQKLSRKAKSIFAGLKKSDADFWVYSPFSLPVHHISWARPFNKILLMNQLRWVKHKLGIQNPLVWVVCPAAFDVAIKMKRCKLVYQRTDRHEDTPNVDNEIIGFYDRSLKASADITVYVNRFLYDEEFGQCKRAFFLDHGVDYEMFASAEKNQYVPPDIANIRKPIVGYFGGMADHKLDTEFIKRLIKLLPEISFVFVGDAPRDYCDTLAGKNVWMLGQKPYEQVPHYGKCFDVGILPWKINRWTEAANPIKLKEYLALGKPIISTSAFTELQQYLDVVYKADTPESFAKCIERALAEDCPDIVTARRKKVQNASWDSKARMVLNELFPGMSND